MTNSLYPYYERELAFMRDMAGEFARNYPHVAGRLNLERHRCDDPHVERLIEAFCLLAARIHHRLDADFPEVTQALLNLVYPHYLRPVPSMSVAQFSVALGEQPRKEVIEIGQTTQFQIGPDFCKFQTVYPTEIWPIEVAYAALHDTSDIPVWARGHGYSSGIVLGLSADQPFSVLEKLESLRFYLAGTGSAPYTLHELILGNCAGILVRDRNQPQKTPLRLEKRAKAIGFADNEGILPYSNRSFLGFRLLHEYFCFPQKFLFFDIEGLSVLEKTDIGKELEIFIGLDHKIRRTTEFTALRLSIGSENFLLGCSPVVNLFPKVAEQVRIDHTVHEYPVIVDSDRAKSFEIYSIDAVTARNATTWQKKEYRPFFSFRHGDLRQQDENAFWHFVRRKSALETGTELFISLVDSNFEAADLQDEILEIRTTCTNRDLPQNLDLQMAFGEIHLSDSRVQGRFIHRPTPSLTPPVDRDLDWRVISMLGLNYLSVAGTEDGGSETLREVLELYNFSEDPTVRKQIASVLSVATRPVRTRTALLRGKEVVPVFCHGMAVELDLDVNLFVGTGPYLFLCVLEHFFALFSSVNSFSQLTATVKATEPARRATWLWPPHSGQRVFL